MTEHDERHGDIWQEERDGYQEDEQTCSCNLVGWAEFVGCDHEHMSEDLESLVKEITGRA